MHSCTAPHAPKLRTPLKGPGIPSRQSVWAHSRQLSAPAAFKFFQQLLPRQRSTLSDEQKQKRDRLLEILSSGRSSEALPEVSTLVDILAGTGLPFQEQRLGGGPWEVRYTKGTPQLWRATFAVGRLANDQNSASQDLDPASRTVINRAEYYAGGLWMSAAGTYTPMVEGAGPTTMPVPVRADIQGAKLYLWGAELDLPFVRGSGFFEVMYLDDELRIFRSGSSIAVQVKVSALKRRRAL